jgi:hypothetical protein
MSLHGWIHGVSGKDPLGTGPLAKTGPPTFEAGERPTFDQRQLACRDQNSTLRR